MSNKTVLCAVDISNKNSDIGVLQQAARMAAIDDAQLDVITVVPDFGMSVVGTFFEPHHHDSMVDEARQRLNDVVAKALGDEANAKVRHLVATGNAYEQILHTAEANNADLIVIGDHKPDFKDYLLGPNAARVVRHSGCSVYVVR